MTAPINNSQMKLIVSETMSYRAPLLAAPKPTFFARIRSTIGKMAEQAQRRAVVNELATLSDRELADIGLNRGDISRVFDQHELNSRHYA